MARVLVTGATGFIGKHLVPHLLARGDQVRCLIHEMEERVAGVDCVHGDITAPATLVPALRGIDVVYHLAGATVVASPHQYKAVNALGTRNVGAACARRVTPPVLIFLSSLAAAGPTSPDRPLREEDPPTPVSEYGRSKLMAERHLRQLAGRLPITILRPPGVFGPGDPNTIKLFKVARLGVNLIPGSAAQQLSFIYVDDLVTALPEAAARGQRLCPVNAGQDHSQGIYFVAMDECPALADLGDLAGRIMGCASIRNIVLPTWASRIAARATDFAARLTMQPMLLTSDKMREALAGSWICSGDKAKRAWGFSCQTGLADGFAKTVAWYRQHKWL
jgi:nucleoside-diphosphate-sugar epimerase